MPCDKPTPLKVKISIDGKEANTDAKKASNSLPVSVPVPKVPAPKKVPVAVPIKPAVVGSGKTITPLVPLPTAVAIAPAPAPAPAPMEDTRSVVIPQKYVKPKDFEISPLFKKALSPAPIASAPAAPVVVKPETECDKLERKIKDSETTNGLQ